MSPAPAAPPLLAAEGLVKAFGGVRAVDGVSLTLARGEVLALIGPNGAGKSTLFNLVDGQLRPDAGTVRLGGRDLAGAGPRRAARLGVGRTFQTAATFASMTVRENLQLALLAHAGRAWRPWGRARAAFGPQADALLALVGITPQASRPCGELAYGDVKRVDLALALAGNPRLLLMDEPTAGMGQAERGELMTLAAGLARARNLGVLFTEHDTGVVFAHADRVIVLDRGRVLAEGPPAAIRADPAVRAAYLGQGA